MVDLVTVTHVSPETSCERPNSCIKWSHLLLVQGLESILKSLIGINSSIEPAFLRIMIATSIADVAKSIGRKKTPVMLLGYFVSPST